MVLDDGTDSNGMKAESQRETSLKFSKLRLFNEIKLIKSALSTRKIKGEPVCHWVFTHAPEQRPACALQQKAPDVPTPTPRTQDVPGVFYP